MKRIGVWVLVFCICVAALPAGAQEAARSADYQQRLELARKMHEIRPTSLQVQAAVDRAARTVPEAEKSVFKEKVMASIDQKVLEDISVKAMAEVFTVPELQRMIDYFSTPESRAISQKTPLYQGMIQPEITKMLDAALLKMRLGGGGKGIGIGQQPLPQSVPPKAPAVGRPGAPSVPQVAPPATAPGR